ncbi:MAG: hypothetical protein RSC51_08440, partial [Oscillospiraceae bacterium]
VKSGLGIAVAPYYLIRLDEDFKDSYVELEEHMEGAVGISWRRDHYLSEAGSEFIETTKNYFSAFGT